jgi:prolyl-tRNA editing enzyme YbaK/EbsC (Cys-tRNA(Pro) deacylase)
MEIHKTVLTIENILKEKGFWYEKFEHEEVRTSKEASEVRDGYTLSQGAKALIVRVKQEGVKKFVMIVVPGDKKFDTKRAKEILKTKDIRFASEEEVVEITEGVLPGGVPPFGNIFGLEVYVDSKVFDEDKIIFNAGDKKISIGMMSSDYKGTVNPKIVSIT